MACRRSEAVTANEALQLKLPHIGAGGSVIAIYRRICYNIHMALLTPPSSEQHPERQSSAVRRTLSSIGSSITSAVKWVFAVRVPQRLQRQGLSQQDYDYISKRFYEITRGTLQAEQEEIVQQSATPVRDMFEANGWHADGKRAEGALDQLIGEFELRDKPDVVAFLKDQFTPLPGGVSWQGMPTNRV